ncbi:MAG: hypothetical protein KatS3mg077_2837 [Candidatus Binatia bacterium]|nr:MAG: hypothetical protein KatS3mg077_2837 [Candidatus Binatia bacterium]
MFVWGRKLARVAVGMVETGAWLATLVVVVAVFVCWHAIHAPDMPVLRKALARLELLFSGQRIEAVAVEARVDPAREGLEAKVTLRLDSAQAPRPELYFLLDPGLRIEQGEAEVAGAPVVPLACLQIGPLVRCPLPQPARSAQVIHLSYAGRPSLRPRECRITRAEVLLPTDCLWYPLDGQGFFQLAATIQLPASWQLVETGSGSEIHWRGQSREYRWQSERPVAGFGLIAGAYRFQERWAGAVRLRAYVPSSDTLDVLPILDTMEAAYGALADRLGNPGFSFLSLFVHPELDRAFHDGAGAMGIPRRALASEDRGFALIAHELAHSWWGGTVTGGWLRAGSGPQWIIEGFAELSSLLATEAVHGQEALVRRMLGELYDPATQQAVADMTVLDNAWPRARARDTIYRKGTYVAWMLRHVVGDDAFFAALRDIATTYSYKEIGVREVQEVLERRAGKPLADFFRSFVRGRDTLDFSVDPAGPGTLTVTNAGSAKWTWPVPLLVRKSPTSEAQWIQVVPPGEVRLDSADSEVIVDPFLQLADPIRENNRYPRREDPLFLAPSEPGTLVVQGEPFPWSRTRARLRLTSGDVKEWELARGLLQPPLSDPDRGWFVLTLADPARDLGSVLVLESDGSRRTVGAANYALPTQSGAILAAAGEKVVRYGASGRARTILRLLDQRVDALVAVNPPEELGIVTSDSAGSRLLRQRAGTEHFETLLSWEHGIPFVTWSSTTDSFFVGLANGPSWEIWQVPSAGENSPQVLVQGAIALSDLALGPDGTRLAFVASGSRTYPRLQRQVYVLDLTEQTVRSWATPELDFFRVTWANDGSLLALARRIPDATLPVYPWPRLAVRIDPQRDEVQPLQIGADL